MSELTREQVVAICNGENAGYKQLRKIMDTDAALRVEIEREKKRVEVYRIAGEHALDQAIDQIDDLRAQLTAMTAERDEARLDRDAEGLTAHGLADLLNTKEQQLTASEARCTRLEEALKLISLYIEGTFMRDLNPYDILKTCQQALTTQVRCARMEEALKFYADPQTYGLHGGSSDRAMKDHGTKAQQALIPQAPQKENEE